MQVRLAVVFALCLCAASAARAQSRGNLAGDYQSSREESAPVPPPAPAATAAAPGIATGDDVDLVAPSAAKKERARAAEAKARAEAEARARAEAEAKVRAETEARIRAEVEARVRAETEAKLRAEADAKARADADAKARAEADAKARADADAKARADADVRARASVKSDAEAKAQLEADAKAAAFLSGDARPGAPAAAAPAAAAVAQPVSTAGAASASPCVDAAKARHGKKKKGATAPCLAQQLPLPADPVPAARDAEDDAGLVDAPRRVVLVGGPSAAPASAPAAAVVVPAPAPAPIAAAPAPAPVAAAPAPVSVAVAAVPVAAAPVAVAAVPAAPGSRTVAQPAAAAPSAPVAAVPAALAAAQAPGASSTLVVPSAPTRNDPPPVRVARADVGAQPAAFDSRAGSSSALTPATGALLDREAPARRAAHAVVRDALLIGPVGLKVNDLAADVDVGERVQVGLGWRYAVDDATATHHSLLLGLRGSRCDADALCPGLAWFLRGSYSPSAQADYGVNRIVAGHTQLQADRLGWSGELGGAGLGYRTLGGFLVAADVQLDSLSLDYTKNTRGSASATSAKLTQLRMRGELGWARGGFSATASFAGYAYLGDAPSTTTGMPLRGALIDDGIAGLASAPQAAFAKAAASYEFTFGLSAAASYGYLAYAGNDWLNAQVISFKLQQRISRFDLGVGVAFMLDNPSTLPPGATLGDYATTYATASAGASF